MQITQCCCGMQLVIRAPTFADALWLGSSLDWSAPTPRLGSWVWKTDMRPPVGDSSLKAACRAEPRADCVSMVFWNKFGRLFSRSCTSWKRNGGTGLFFRQVIDPCGKMFVCHCFLRTEVLSQCRVTILGVNVYSSKGIKHSKEWTKQMSLPLCIHWGLLKGCLVLVKRYLWRTKSYYETYNTVIYIILTLRLMLSSSYHDVCFLTFSRLVFSQNSAASQHKAGVGL